MGTPKVNLNVRVAYDYEATFFSSTIEYPEEGFDVVLRAEEKNNNLSALLESLVKMCKKVKDVKGEMLLLKLDVTVNSLKLEEDFQRWREINSGVFKIGEMDIKVNESLSTKIPDLFAPAGSMAYSVLSFSKYRKKRFEH